MVPRMNSETTSIAVASAMPSVVKAARIGCRVILRNIITVGCDRILSMAKPRRQHTAETCRSGRLHRHRRGKRDHVAERAESADDCGNEAQRSRRK